MSEKERMLLIVYHNILQKLSDAGWSTYRLQKEKRLSNGIIMQLRAEKPITTETIDKICSLLDCQPSDLISFVQDEQGN